MAAVPAQKTTKENDEDWAILREKRLLLPTDKTLLVLLDDLQKAHPRDFKTLHVSVQSCRSFEEIARRFAKPFSFPKWFGENADALYDLLNDLPCGRYIVTISGAASLDRKVRNTLEQVLGMKIRPEEGAVGYCDGEAVFVLR